MSLSADLIQHAFQLLGFPLGSTDKVATQVDHRRAVSASYYALFHHLSEACVEQIAPHVSDSAANRIYRWLDHGEMKKICREFSALQPKQPLRDLLNSAVSVEMQTMALSFIKLQEARHIADYDPAYEVDWDEAKGYLESAVIAIAAWDRIKDTAEANIFILSLLLWKNWEDKNRR